MSSSGKSPVPASALRLGIAGPVGTGKSSVIMTLCHQLADTLSIGVVTNDIYTDEDARMIRAAGVIDPDRVRAVETGACPHTAIRDDISANQGAADQLEADHGPLDLILIESGGDNLTATFSPALVAAQLFVIDVAGGGDVARKGGPGIERADLLVINKTDLGLHVGVDVSAMVSDALAARSGGRVVALSRSDAPSVEELVGWVGERLAEHRSGQLVPQDPGPMAPHSHAAPSQAQPSHAQPSHAAHSHVGHSGHADAHSH